MKRKRGIFEYERIVDLLKEMRTYGMDGQIEEKRYLLEISETDGAYSWDLGLLTKDKSNVEEWLEGDCYFYSLDELFDSLWKNRIIF